MPPTQTDEPSVRTLFGEATSLICFMPFYGPPVVFLAAPWLCLGLLLSGPFALLLTFVLAATVLVAGVGAVLAMPYLIVRGLRAARGSLAGVPLELRRVAA